MPTLNIDGRCLRPTVDPVGDALHGVNGQAHCSVRLPPLLTLTLHIEAGPASFPFIVDPDLEAVDALEKTAGLRPVTVKPKDLVVCSDSVDDPTAYLLALEFDDDQLANQRLPFWLQM